jgi:hypothetical protein
MDSQDGKDLGVPGHGLVRRSARLTFLVAAVISVNSGIGSNPSVEGHDSLAPITAHSQVLRQPAAERAGAWADGAIDSSEDNDPTCDWTNLPSIRTIGSLTASAVGAWCLTGSELSRSYAARGPPFA